MSSSPPTNRNLVIDYYPAWFDNTGDLLASYKKGGSKERVDVINIAFAMPQADGSVHWNDWDKNPVLDGRFKQTIKELQSQGKKVVMSVGGATAHWNLDKPEQLARSTAELAKRWGLDGVDIDCEIRNDNRKKIIPYAKELRRLMPREQGQWLSYCGWSIGAYAPGDPGYCGGNSGIDIEILNNIKNELDMVNVMSYDAFESSLKFDPRQSIDAFRKLMGNRPDKVALGIEIGAQTWPPGVVKTTEDAKVWVEKVRTEGYAGVMFWTLDMDAGPRKANGHAEPDHAFLNLAKAKLGNNSGTFANPTKMDVSPSKKKPSEVEHKKEADTKITSESREPVEIGSVTNISPALTQSLTDPQKQKPPEPDSDVKLVRESARQETKTFRPFVDSSLKVEVSHYTEESLRAELDQLKIPKANQTNLLNLFHQNEVYYNNLAKNHEARLKENTANGRPDETATLNSNLKSVREDFDKRLKDEIDKNKPRESHGP